MAIPIAAANHTANVLAKLPMGLEVVDDKRSDPTRRAEPDCRASIA